MGKLEDQWIPWIWQYITAMIQRRAYRFGCRPIAGRSNEEGLLRCWNGQGVGQEGLELVEKRMEVDWNSAKMYWTQCHWKSWKQFCQYSERWLRQFQVSSLYLTDRETSGRSWKGSHFCKSIFRWFPLLLSILHPSPGLQGVWLGHCEWGSKPVSLQCFCWCSMFCSPPQSLFT